MNKHHCTPRHTPPAPGMGTYRVPPHPRNYQYPGAGVGKSSPTTKDRSFWEILWDMVIIICKISMAVVVIVLWCIIPFVEATDAKHTMLLYLIAFTATLAWTRNN